MSLFSTTRNLNTEAIKRNYKVIYLKRIINTQKQYEQQEK